MQIFRKIVLTGTLLYCSFGFMIAQNVSELKFENITPQSVPQEKGSAVSVRSTNLTHTVQTKQTLYGLSKQYGVSVEEIKKSNNLATNDIKIGQVLVIPSSGGERQVSDASSNSVEVSASAPIASVEPPKMETSPVKRESGSVTRSSESQGTSTTSTLIPKWSYHMVQPGEDLSSIASDYGIPVDQLQSWNDDITSDNMNVGDRLKVKLEFISFQPVSEISREMPSAEATQTTASVTVEAPEISAPATSVSSETQRLTAEAAAPVNVSAPANVATETIVEPSANMGNKIESGTFLVVSNPEEKTKYYAYHKTLPIGSTVKLMIPNNAGYIDVKIVNRIKADRAEILGLSPDCARIIGKGNKNVSIRY